MHFNRVFQIIVHAALDKASVAMLKNVAILGWALDPRSPKLRKVSFLIDLMRAYFDVCKIGNSRYLPAHSGGNEEPPLLTNTTGRLLLLKPRTRLLAEIFTRNAAYICAYSTAIGSMPLCGERHCKLPTQRGNEAAQNVRISKRHRPESTLFAAIN